MSKEEPTMKDYKQLQEEIHKINEQMEEVKNKISQYEEKTKKGKVKDEFLDFDLDCYFFLFENMTKCIEYKHKKCQEIIDYVKNKRKENKK